MSTPTTPSAEPVWAAFAAIDWASQNHSWSLLPAAGGAAESGKLANTPEAVELWAADLQQRFHGPIAVSIEQKRGPVVYMLSKYSHLVLYPVPPTMSAAFRRAFSPSGAKTDPGDAALLLNLLVHHRDRLHPLSPDTPETRLLRFLVEQRRHLIQQKVRLVQRLTDSLQQHFPQLRCWFGDLDTPLVDALLRHWPSLQQMQRSHPGTLKRFFVEHNCRNADLVQERIRAIYAAIPATTDSVVMEASERNTAATLNLLRAVREQVAALEKRIATVTADHPDAPIFRSFPGAGAATVPRLIAAFGTDREAWASAADLQRFSGIAPVHKSSGNSASVVMRRACPKFLRQTFHEFAGQSIPFSTWAKAFYVYQREHKHAAHHAAVRSLAFRWIRILFRCWKDRQLYDERLFLEAQRRRNSLLGESNAAAKSLRWDSVAGFARLTDTES